MAGVSSFGLTEVRVRGFRSLLDVTFRPGPMTALVGEANTGKSNTLAAIRALLDPAAALGPEDAPIIRRTMSTAIEGRLADGTVLSVAGTDRSGAPPVLFLPAALRSGPVIAPSSNLEGAEAVLMLVEAIRELAAHRASAEGPSDAVGAQALIDCISTCCEEGARGLVTLIEEPELFLRPHSQRFLYRLLRSFALMGNQVIYSTHAPAFLNVARLEEFALVERSPRTGTRIVQPEPLQPGEEFRAMSEFDAERSELFLSRAAILVEGRTEKLALPFVFQCLGHDADREAISIVECGGKSNIPLFVRVCWSVGVPFVVVHDRDAPAGRPPSAEDQRLNALIREVAGRNRTVMLQPDFEAVAGLRGHDHKPEKAWQRFRSLAPADVPPPLARAVELALRLARD